MRKTKGLSYQSFRSSAIIGRFKDLMRRKITSWIVEPRALVCQHIPVAKGANPPKSKLFGMVACPKTSITKFSHPFDQRDQARCHLRLSLLVINKRWEQMSIHPFRENMHIKQEPPLRRTSSEAFEGGINISFSPMTT
jgi:hypothetical protein